MKAKAPPTGGNKTPLPRAGLERIHYSNQSVTPAPAPCRVSAGSGTLVIHRMMSRPVVMRVMTMLVMRRRRKACTCKQEQRCRDSDDLTHDSTLVFDELLSGRLA